MTSFAVERSGGTLAPPDADLTGDCGLLIPAFDEESRVGAVVQTALEAGIGPVLVVDDGSTDGTADRALAAGAWVLSLPKNRGKGGAVAAGAGALRTDYLLLIDADLVGLTAQHLVSLARPVLSGTVDTTRGICYGSRWQTTTAQHLSPQLNGQRALRREALLAIPGLAESRYGLEILITNAARRGGWRTLDIPLNGVSQVMKEEKRGLLAGLRARAGMYRDILTALLRRDAP